jgi:hypothetical protein
MTTPAPMLLPSAAVLRTGAPRAPVAITQELFETDPALLRALLEVAEIGDPQWAGVIENYLSDLRLAGDDGVQPDLFLAMLPYVWGMWQRALVSDVARNTASALGSALFRRPHLIAHIAGAPMQNRVESFVLDSFAGAIALDSRISSDLTWSPLWVALAACWPQMVAGLWDDLIQCRVENHARTMLAYFARLAYSDAENPLLSEASPAVELWGPASFDTDMHWGLDAVAALARRLSWDSAEFDLGRMLVRLSADPAFDVARLVASDLRAQRRSVFLRRCQMLLENLGRPGLDKRWSDDTDSA